MLVRSLLLLAAASLLSAQPKPPAVLLGAAWYPEQWPEARWDADLQLMQAAGIDMVRIGEFAWSTMEPREGQYTLDWIDRAIAAAARHHIFTVLGTPTDAPPAWLTQKYPDTLRVDETGAPRSMDRAANSPIPARDIATSRASSWTNWPRDSATIRM